MMILDIAVAFAAIAATLNCSILNDFQDLTAAVKSHRLKIKKEEMIY